MFQKSHYEFLADWLHNLPIPSAYKSVIISSLMWALKSDNAKFDKKKFEQRVIHG